MIEDQLLLPPTLNYSLEGLVKDPEETIKESETKFQSFKEYIEQVLNGLEKNVHEVSKKLIDLQNHVTTTDKLVFHNPTLKVSNFIYKNLSKNDNPNHYLQGIEELEKLFLSKDKNLGPIHFLSQTYLLHITASINTGLKTGFTDINLLDKSVIEAYKKSSFKPLIKPLADFYKKVDKLSDSPALLTLIDNDDYLGNKRTATIFIANRNNMIYSFWSTLLQVNYGNKLLPEMKAITKKELLFFIKQLIKTSEALEKNIKEAKGLITKINIYREATISLQKKLISYTASHEDEHKDISDCERLLINFYAHPFSYYFPLQQLRRQGLESIKAGLEFSTQCYNNLK